MEKSRQPLVLVFAGPNGSGKSSVTNFVEKAGVYFGVWNAFAN